MLNNKMKGREVMNDCSVKVWADFVVDLGNIINKQSEVYLNIIFKNEDDEMIGGLQSTFLLTDLDDDDEKLEIMGDMDRDLQIDKEYWEIRKLQDIGTDIVYRLTSKDKKWSQEFTILK